MDTYIVRQAILDKEQQVVAYEILYRQDEKSLYSQQDMQVADAIEQVLTQISDEKILGGHTAYLTFTPNLLMRNVPKLFLPQSLVIQIEENSILHPVAQRCIYRFKKQGYRIALKGFEFSPRYFGIMDILDFIKVDFAHESASLENIIKVAHSLDKKIIAYNVKNQQMLERAVALGCDYVQGNFVSQPKESRVYRMDHMQSNFFQLMVEATKEEPDIDEISKIISRDVTLAFSLIRLVNSAYFALPNRVTSVQQALVVLGLHQLKQWVYLLSFRQGSNSRQDELIRLSFLRGNFCMQLAKQTGVLPITPAEAYLLGMFSTLGTLMEVPLSAALAELPIAQPIKDGLLEGSGPCGDLYHLMVGYEQADWASVGTRAAALQLPEQVLRETYIACVEEVDRTWGKLQAAGN